MSTQKSVAQRLLYLKRPQYLGDGVYASFDGYQIWLKTSDGIETTNEIAIEPEVQLALVQYFDWIAENSKQIQALFKELNSENFGTSGEA